jgi:hypothetical protein
MIANIPIGQKQHTVTKIALVMKSGGGGSAIVTYPGATYGKIKVIILVKEIRVKVTSMSP